MNILNAVNTELNLAMIDFSAVFTCTQVTDKWEHDNFVCVFKNRATGEAFQFDYKMGIGHRHKLGRIMLPKVDSVLHSLIMDSYSTDESFSDWCANYGYDDDSIKAKGIYEACIENTKKLQGVFAKREKSLENIKELLEDF